MSQQNAVQQAIDLLTGRLTEARERQAELEVEIVSIEKALTSLGGVTVNPDDRGNAEPSTPNLFDGTGIKQSVRAATKAILDSENRAFTPVEVRDLIPANVMDGKSKDQRINSVRTAMWSLRQKGEARLIDDSHTISTKWLTDSGADHGLPAVNGSGPSAFEEAHT